MISAAVLERRQADIDHVAVERRCDFDRTVALNIGERVEAVRVLHAKGYNDGVIADRLGYTVATICSIRGRNGLPANVDHGRNQVRHANG